MTGVIADRFEIGEFIAQGGMGAVYRGLDRQTGQTVAIKLLKPDVVSNNPEMMDRFAREGEALRKLDHPNIVKMFAALPADNQQCIVMEYVGGGSLRDLLRRETALPVSQVVAIALELSDALARAHHLKIIHRDLKPDNVLLAEDGTPRLTDFGVARLGESTVTRTDIVVGTMTYLSPEALGGEALDARTDIWAFGVLLFELLTGQCPFPDIAAILTKPAPDLDALRPDAPIALIDLIYRMLDKDRNQRIPSARQVGAELEAILKGIDTGLLRRREPIRANTIDNATVVVETPSTPIVTPNNLPVQVTPFVGREAELTELAQLIADPNVRLITILGPGGMGKTRLALEAASVQLPAYANGVYFVALAPLSLPEFIVATIAEAVRFQFYAGGEPRQQLLDYFREKSILLVMDNFEHLLAGADVIGEILQAAPGVKVLVTSRERLNVQGETLFRIEGMQVPTAANLKDTQQYTGYSAIALFLQSARRVQPSFTLTAADMGHLLQICRQVQGMPLGIVLAAAWIDTLSLAEIAQEIASSLDFLETEQRDTPTRQRSIRAVFDYSWNLLSEDERTVFKRLTVFRGGFTREAAQAATGASLRALTGLVYKSMLRRDPQTGRYDIHELLRQYGAQQLDQSPQDSAAARDQHSAYYASFLADQETPLWSAAEDQVLATMDVEQENIDSSIAWAVRQNHVDSLNKCLQPLVFYYEARGRYQDCFDLLDQIDQQLNQRADTAGQALLWRIRSRKMMFATYMGWVNPDSQQAAQSCIDHLRSLGQEADTGYALEYLTFIAAFQGQYDQAVEYARENQAWAERYHDDKRRARGLIISGMTFLRQGNYPEAKRRYEEALAILRPQGYLSGMAACLNFLGDVHHALWEEQQAQECYEQALTLLRKLNNRRDTAGVLSNLGNVFHRLGRYEEAQRHYEQSLAILRDIGDRPGMAAALLAAGGVWTLGEYAQAGDYVREALRLYREMGDRQGIANSLAQLGSALMTVGRYQEALACHEECLALRQKIGNPIEIADTFGHLSRVYMYSGNYAKAAHYLDQILQFITGDLPNGLSAMHPHLFGNYNGNRIGLLLLTEDYEAVLQLSEQMRPSAERAGPFIATTALTTRGEAYLGLNRLPEAHDAFVESLRISHASHVPASSIANIVGLASVRGRQGNVAQAVELLAFTMDNRYTFYHTKVNAEKRLNAFKSQLAPDEFAAAVARGKTLALDAVVTDLLNEQESRNE